MTRTTLFLAAAMILLFAAMASKPALLALPGATQAQSGGFDTPRALARLKRILDDQRPHPVDSAANDALRARLVGELAALGLSPVVTDTIDCNGGSRNRHVTCARIRNVRATIGPAAGKHVLLVSHYDSTPVGPGASDDGIGVAAMLEVAAQLKDRRLARPVTFLFDEGEEAGLNGARAFLRDDPLAARIDTAINLESRGVTGPAIMFETSRPNGAALAAFKSASWRPVANSLTADFYRLIPNDTDVSVLKERGWTILNFAVIGNETRYHSPGDRLDSLDPRSVRHMGEQALRAAAELAATPPRAAGERAYADLLGRGLVVIPAALAWIGLGLLLLAAAWQAWRRRGPGMKRAATIAPAAMLAAGAWTFLLQWLAGLVRAGDYWRGHPEIVAAAIDATAIAAAMIVLTNLGRRIAVGQLRAGYWLAFLLIGGLLALAAPGAAIFFLLPPAIALLGMALEPRWRGSERVGAVAAWVLLLLSWAPLLHLSEVLLDFDAGWVFSALSALVVFPALIELKAWSNPLSRPAIAAPLVLAALACWVAVLVAPAYSPDRKQAFGIEYVREGDSARWMVVNDGAALPAAFAGYQEGVKVPWSTRRRWAAAAPLLSLPAPSIERLGESATPLGRRIRLRLHAAGSDALILLGDPEARFLAARAGNALSRFGKGKSDAPYQLRCNGRSCEGLVVDLLIGSRARVGARLVGLRYALPAQAGPLVAVRPRDAAPQYNPDASYSVTTLQL